ncbi:YceI family protein [Leptospira koniambonensis]|uniref:YceI family protein n=1 Tax=Leptospira koniambonensis TaxID=2484950 RepID=A0A4V3JNJ5_9LEPT|nr:YceI family protein [Leptospira koniambonensis]TGL35199.1 YceI family protein [Leptospira koniambonensis]
MKSRINSFYISALIFSVFSLAGSLQFNSLSAEESCKYSVTQEATGLEWKAFKFTEKTGVGGKFIKVNISGAKSAAKIPDALKGLKFSIDALDLDSGNAERDPKIKGAFFGNLKKSGKIEGSVSSAKLEADGKSGTGVVKLIWNGVSKDVPLQFTLTGEVLEAKGSLDVNNWNASKALAALNTVCSDLHKSKDGKSVLWPDVEITIKSTLKKDCK